MSEGIKHSYDNNLDLDIYEEGNFYLAVDQWSADLHHVHCRPQCADGCYLLPTEIEEGNCGHCGKINIPDSILSLYLLIGERSN